MKKYIIAIFIVLLVPNVYAEDIYGRVCIVKSTGKLIEFQSGQASLGALTANAIGSGFNLPDIEEKYVTKSEWLQLEETWINAPLIAKKAIKDAEKEVKKDELKDKFGWTDQDIEDLKEILK